MKIELLTENIQPHISTISKNLATSSTLPILTNLLLKATETTFVIQATDLELGIEVQIPSKITQEGTTTVPGREFLDVLASLPQDKITLTKEDNTLEISSRKTKVKLQTIPADDFPTLFEEKGDSIGTYTTKDIDNTFAKIMFSSATDETRPELTGVLLKQCENHVDYVATDGFRLCRITKKDQKIGDVGDTVIIPRKLLNEIVAQKKDGEMYLNKKGHQIIFESDATTIVGRMLHGNFPAYERVIPSTHTISAEVPKEDLLTDLKISNIIARQNSNMVKCNFLKDTLQIKATAASLGEQESELEIKKEGEDIELTFNSKYLLDAFRAVSSPVVKMEITTPHEPVVFRDEKDPNYLHVVMPVRA